MPKRNYFFLGLLFLIGGMAVLLHSFAPQSEVSGAPPYSVAEEEVPTDLSPYEQWSGWARPAGPAKVALQIGHWDNHLFPEELAALRNNTGAQSGQYTERQINYAIAHATRDILVPYGIQVEILPATVPPEYWADVFLAIHADGSTDPRVRGYKFARSWRDLTGNADQLVYHLDREYAALTGMPFDDNITRNMRGYYAFSWWRFEHAVHPMTTSAIAETGFVTSPVDRKIIAEQPELSAQALANGILAYLREQNLIDA